MKTFKDEGWDILLQNIAVVGPVEKRRHFFKANTWGYNIVCDGYFRKTADTKAEAEASRKALLKMIEQVK